MSKYALAIVVFAGTLLFVIVGYSVGDRLKVSYMNTGADIRHTSAPGTPAAAVENLYDNIRRRQFDLAYRFINNQKKIDFNTFLLDVNGRDNSLRTFSALHDLQTQQLTRDGDEARVRASLQWATAVGAFYETRDFQAFRSGDGWKVDWVSDKQERIPPQVVAVSYPRWDVFRPGATRVNVNEELPSPKVAVISQNLVQDADTLVLVGELANQDTLPAFVAVKATIVGENGKLLGDESSAENVIHTLLPGKKTPFRIDFPGVSRSQVKSVKLNVSSSLVSAAGDPLIDVAGVRVELAEGKNLLRGQVTNRSGAPVTIPQVLAAVHDSSGKIIWVQNTYLDRALLPGTPAGFAMRIPDQYATQAATFDVAVNSYRVD